jgi:ATP-binding cassette subfamily B (MDR/TAP) protein 1
MALVSQEPVLYSETIRDNIMPGTEVDVGEAEVVRACKDANIYDFIVCFSFCMHFVWRLTIE